MSADYIKKLTGEQRKILCSEIRHLLVKTVTNTGGHLASNLGTVELIVAMHTVFDTPKDKFVFDVGHQAYTHKIITGRAKKLNTIRTEDGISGFPKSVESEHDSFIGGHSSISISAALGMAKAMELDGDDHSVVAVIGDGALTGGEAYEGLNNAGKTNCNLVVVLNENEMSISKNTGALALYLAQLKSTQKYYKTKNSVKDILENTPVIGKTLGSAARNTKRMLKFALYQSNLFENLGFKYIGPIDGHNVEEMTEALSVAKMMKRPCLVHVYTKKGKGYAPAEENSGEYHGISPVNSASADTVTFTEAFGRELCDISRTDENICTITAAMKYGTGLQYFYKEFPERFFDVGIAEEHAVTFSAGLAAGGKLPVFAVYSSFLQRSYDQLIHDCSIEKRHIVLAVDRAGFVGEDGETHHGMFDVPMLTTVPGSCIYSPSDNKELSFCLKKALYDDEGIAVLRYPRGAAFYDSGAKEYYSYRHISNGNKKIIFTYGRITANAILLSDKADVLQAVRIYPIEEKILEILSAYDEIYFFEEAFESGSISEKICARLIRNGYRGKVSVTAVNAFIPHNTVVNQLKIAGLDYEGMKKIIGE
ncbi:MAG: 1-deoxy-D-xylulose-5-phosphate synthase [Ruminiclostridium sp.]|nr:1-deoxy-D-xylulose-5-phosphate synthase [Ruminiclostridium sp.]